MSAPLLILFGAFDRHNFGDLLLAQVAARLFAGREIRMAGLAERDLGAAGGHRVRAIGALAEECGEREVDLVHVGGELLGCSLYQAAVMLQAPDPARQAIARYDRNPRAARAWARRQLGIDLPLPYSVPRRLFAAPRRWSYLAVGGVDFANQPAPMRAAAVADLSAADALSVRDARTRAALAQVGIEAPLMPDPAVLTARLFAEEIAVSRAGGEVAAVREACPQGYLALQFAAEFGDDATLDQVAEQLREIRAASGLGIVALCAGSAPWHDDPAVYRRLFTRLPAGRLFVSSRLWDICALIAGSVAFCGSSLHGRVVAHGFGRPAASLVAEGQHPAKVAAYVDTWEAYDPGTVVPPARLAEGVASALAVDPGVLSSLADAQVRRIMDAFHRWRGPS